MQRQSWKGMNEFWTRLKKAALAKNLGSIYGTKSSFGNDQTNKRDSYLRHTAFSRK